MKILLRNTDTRLYANGKGLWIKSRDEAHDFGKSPQAYQHAKEFQLENAEVVFAHDDRKDDFALPPKSFLPLPIETDEISDVVSVALGDKGSAGKTHTAPIKRSL